MKFEEYRNQVEKINVSDYVELLNMGRKWKKIEVRPYDIKVGVIGSASIQLIVSVLKVLLCKYGIYADVYEGEYNGISMDVFDSESPFYRFGPSYVIVIPDYRDIRERAPDILADETKVEKAVGSVAGYYRKICDTIHKKLPNCQILLSDFVEPVEDPLGSLGGNYLFSQSQFCRQVNLELIKYRKPFVKMVDIDKLAACIGKTKWFDESAYFLNKSGFALEYIGYFCEAFARQFDACMGKVRKCIVLDLDNTLWGGVVGDLGYEKIILDPNDAEGEAYIYFQKYLLSLKNRGVILAVCSKNDLKNAKEPFEKNENMILKLEDISFFAANWDDKASNIRVIAKELNIGLDSMVFFDDNPTERELVREFVPEVQVIDVPKDPAYYVRALDQSFCFEWNQITIEDINRIQSYRDNAARAELYEVCDNYDEFLTKLEMQVCWNRISDVTVARFSQLTNKSNQFNLRTQRYSDAEIEAMRHSDQYELYTVSLKDKFSNYGVIACVILHFQDHYCEIENWVMSCRVLKKTVEKYTAYKMIEAAEIRNVNEIRAEYILSKKNSMVSNLYDELGFQNITETENKKEYLLTKEKFCALQKRMNYIMKEER